MAKKVKLNSIELNKAIHSEKRIEFTAEFQSITNTNRSLKVNRKYHGVIIFENNAFSHCAYNGTNSNKKYDLTDWKFLGVLAETINKLADINL